MEKYMLFVWKSYHRSSEELAENQPQDGKVLLDTLPASQERRFSSMNSPIAFLSNTAIDKATPNKHTALASTSVPYFSPQLLHLIQSELRAR
jgi:hypothetical protein